MKILLTVLTLGMSTSLLAAGPAQTTPRANMPAAAKATNASGGFWRRTADGDWVWFAEKTESVKSGETNARSTPTEGATRTYTYYRPERVISYPNNFRTPTVNGIDWYLNGRSYFSD